MMPSTIQAGKQMYQWATDLFPVHRSLTGRGVRETLSYIKELLPDLTLHQIASGSEVFDWTVPPEWEISDAWIEYEDGNRVVDIRENTLHVVGYSVPVDTWLTLEELQPHLYSIPSLPDAIPFVTSYYSRKWGFCLSHNKRQSLKKGRYRAVIKSRLFDGILNYADLIIPGKSSREIFFSTYICHPSMGNNELSGPVMAAALAQYISKKEFRKYTYRFVFVPETIGAIVYLHRNREKLERSLRAGYVLTCVGDEKRWSFLPSRNGNTIADRAARHILKVNGIDVKEYSFLSRGSDERQYCSPGIDLPIASVMRSKYEEYPEYHSSLDNLDFISEKGLSESYTVYTQLMDYFETAEFPKVSVYCEPQLGKRGLYPSSNVQGIDEKVRNMRNIIAYADGLLNVDELFSAVNVSNEEGMEILSLLKKQGLIVDASDL